MVYNGNGNENLAYITRLKRPRSCHISENSFQPCVEKDRTEEVKVFAYKFPINGRRRLF